MLIPGAGFEGLAADLTLRSGRHDLMLVGHRPWFEFLPNIHALLYGVNTTELLRLSLERDSHMFVRDTVMEIDSIGAGS